MITIIDFKFDVHVLGTFRTLSLKFFRNVTPKFLGIKCI